MTEREVTEKFEGNRGLVAYTISRYYPQYQYDDDIIQLGNIGLWQAILKHNPDRGTFATLATTCIKHEIDRHFQFLNTQMRKADVCSLDGMKMNGHNKNGDGSESDVSLYRFIAGDADVNWFDSEAILKRLDDKNRFILAKLAKGYNRNEIARELGLTAEAVRLRLIKDIRYAVMKELRCKA